MKSNGCKRYRSLLVDHFVSGARSLTEAAKQHLAHCFACMRQIDRRVKSAGTSTAAHVNVDAAFLKARAEGRKVLEEMCGAQLFQSEAVRSPANRRQKRHSKSA